MTTNASNFAPAPASATATWGTLKSHGNPSAVWFFGRSLKGGPVAEGRLLTGEALDVFRGSATRFWAAPAVAADQASPAQVRKAVAQSVEALTTGTFDVESMDRMAAGYDRARDQAETMARVTGSRQATFNDGRGNVVTVRRDPATLAFSVVEADDQADQAAPVESTQVRVRWDVKGARVMNFTDQVVTVPMSADAFEALPLAEREAVAGAALAARQAGARPDGYVFRAVAAVRPLTADQAAEKAALAADAGPGATRRRRAAQAVQAAPADVALVEAVHPGMLARLAEMDATKAAGVEADQAATLDQYGLGHLADQPDDVARSVEALTTGTADSLAGLLFGQVDRALSADDELVLTTAFLAALDVVRDRLNDRREAAVKAAHAQGATYAELGSLVGLSATRIARLATGTGRYVPRA